MTSAVSTRSAPLDERLVQTALEMLEEMGPEAL